MRGPRDNRGTTSSPAGADAVHERPAGDLLAAGTPYGLVLAGGAAVQTHGLVDARASRGGGSGHRHPAATAEVAGTVRAGMEARGWAVTGQYSVR